MGCGSKRKTGSKDDSKVCGLGARKDGGATFKAGDSRRRGCRKASLGDLCGTPSCFGSIKLDMVPKPILHRNPNVSPAPVQALCKRQGKPLRGFAETPGGIRCRTQRAAEANGRIEAEHKSLPHEEGGLACQALGPHTGSRPGGLGAWMDQLPTRTRPNPNTTKEAAFQSAAPEGRPAPWGRVSMSKEAGTKGARPLGTPCVPKPDSRLSAEAVRMAAVLLLCLSLCPAPVPLRGLTLLLKPEDKHLQLLRSPPRSRRQQTQFLGGFK